MSTKPTDQKPFPNLPPQTPAQRAWLQRVCREALAKRFAS
jgi:hypothetical protein